MTFTHFYSDPHFGHSNVIGHANRPFADVAEMDFALVRNYQKMVASNDFVLWLGDCTFQPSRFAGILNSLPGRKALILGNHDGKPARMQQYGFEFVAEKLWMDLGGVRAIACHYPPHKSSYKGGPHGSRFAGRMPHLGPQQVGIHGHTHESGRIFGKEKRIHVGVDAWDFAPAPWGEVAALARGLVKT